MLENKEGGDNYMNKFVYTPGPTIVRENVRLAMAKYSTNPDLDY